eukprot:scpid43944/ scgid7467/ 
MRDEQNRVHSSHCPMVRCHGPGGLCPWKLQASNCAQQPNMQLCTIHSALAMVQSTSQAAFQNATVSVKQRNQPHTCSLALTSHCFNPLLCTSLAEVVTEGGFPTVATGVTVTVAVAGTATVGVTVAVGMATGRGP